MKRQRIKAVVTAVLLAAFLAFSVRGEMEAPGSGGSDWFYSDKNHHWYCYDENRNVRTGWYYYEGEWYWFDSDGWMEDSGYANIDGASYYFFGNGHMARSQYIGLKYMDADGFHKEDQDIRVVGTEEPTREDRDMITDYLYDVPRGWLAQFEKDGWQMMFYKKKEFFAAPQTDMGIYYVHHSVDTHYKKVKFTDTDALLQGFGEYVGYASGCYKKGSARMERLWKDQVALNAVLNIPDYYSGDVQFYFGKLFAAYLDPQLRESMEQISPDTCAVMGEILHEKDEDPAVYQREKERDAVRRDADAEKAKELGGPGVEKESTGNGGEN